jgi:hypothetical protein
MEPKSSKEIVDRVERTNDHGFGVFKLFKDREELVETNLSQKEAMEIVERDSDCTLAVWWKEFWRIIR